MTMQQTAYRDFDTVAASAAERQAVAESRGKLIGRRIPLVHPIQYGVRFAVAMIVTESQPDNDSQVLRVARVDADGQTIETARLPVGMFALQSHSDSPTSWREMQWLRFLNVAAIATGRVPEGHTPSGMDLPLGPTLRDARGWHWYPHELGVRLTRAETLDAEDAAGVRLVLPPDDSPWLAPDPDACSGSPRTSARPGASSPVAGHRRTPRPAPGYRTNNRGTTPANGGFGNFATKSSPDLSPDA